MNVSILWNKLTLKNRELCENVTQESSLADRQKWRSSHLVVIGHCLHSMVFNSDNHTIDITWGEKSNIIREKEEDEDNHTGRRSKSFLIHNTQDKRTHPSVVNVGKRVIGLIKSNNHTIDITRGRGIWSHRVEGGRWGSAYSSKSEDISSVRHWDERRQEWTQHEKKNKKWS